MTVPLLALLMTHPAAGDARNPILWADVPDIAIVRAKGAYYMSSTTMHMSPGLPIMKSSDLVNWKLVGYAYRTLADNNALNLRDGKNAYGAGSWASSLRFHNGTFYVSTFSSTTGKTHIFTTKSPEHGPWKEISFAPSFHDHSLFFDDDGRVYLVYGADDIRLVELSADLSGVKPNGVHKTIIPNATAVAGGQPGLPAEGSQLFKVNGRYYLCNITWPRNGMRTEIVHRADRIEGPYEGRVMFKDRGIAQGGLIDTPDGRWFAYLFQDSGAVGRIPWLVPMKWVDGWPLVGVEGKAPENLDLPVAKIGVSGIVASGDFKGKTLPLAWQWNHNPDDAHWSLSARPGFLRLTTSQTVEEVVQARNTLTQRTFGPTSAATTRLDFAGLQDGDFAGLVALQKKYGFVAATRAGGKNFLVMVGAPSGAPQEFERVECPGDRVFLRIECDFRNRKDEARFAYSVDGKGWTAIGKPLRMVYDLPHFMGYRFGLFNFSTQRPGGHVDFDSFRLDDKLTLF